MKNIKNVAVVLNGCGHKDGSEIREAVLTLLALSQQNAEARCFAPDAPQADVVNHRTGNAIPGAARNMLEEAARIARGDILPLSRLKAAEFDALILPGGLGAAKNLCTFATEGAKASVLPELKHILSEFHASRKPIGAICIAPAILALAFKGKGIELTVGKPGDASKEIEALGQRHAVCAANACCVDSSFRMVSTPAYMYDEAPLRDVYTGIQKLVMEVLALA